MKVLQARQLSAVVISFPSLTLFQISLLLILIFIYATGRPRGFEREPTRDQSGAHLPPADSAISASDRGHSDEILLPVEEISQYSERFQARPHLVIQESSRICKKNFCDLFQGSFRIHRESDFPRHHRPQRVEILPPVQESRR